MDRKLLIAVGGLVVIIAIGAYFFARPSASPQRSESGTINVVAAEDFYGNVAEQIGGTKVSVVSILSDPNVDPHEYESDVQDGVAITNADIVIENGLEYDTWMDKLLSASPRPGRIVLTAGTIAPRVLPGNPHVWYGIDNMSAVAESIADALESRDPADTEFFKSNLAAFNSSLAPIQAKMDEIKSKYAGTPVGLTETIYLYETQPMSLDVTTPFDFEKAIAEGNDPSASSVSVTDSQVSNKQVKVLIYNSQTITPITSNLEAAALRNNIPVIPVSETMPPNDTYQTWIMGELMVLEQGLAGATGH